MLKGTDLIKDPRIKDTSLPEGAWEMRVCRRLESSSGGVVFGWGWEMGIGDFCCSWFFLEHVKHGSLVKGHDVICKNMCVYIYMCVYIINIYIHEMI